MIDREKVITWLRDIDGFIAGRIGFGQANNFHRTIDEAIVLLKEQEAETEKLRRYVNGFSRDAIPVVRCKDCKWNSGTHDFPYCQMQNVPQSPDWFCAGGERTEKLDG